jgi:hypothetical protein
MSTEAVKLQTVSGTLPAGGALVPVGEELPAPTSLPSPACRRRGILQGAVLVVLVVGAAAGGWYWRHLRQLPAPRRASPWRMAGLRPSRCRSPQNMPAALEPGRISQIFLAAP